MPDIEMNDIASDLVGATLGQEVTEVVSLKRDHVARVTLTGERPPSAIVKRARNPDSPAAIRSDWAGLAFLNGLDVAGPWPRFYGGDTGHNAIVLEDLGDVTQLDELLLGDDAVPARALLADLARSIATLHSTSYGHIDTYRELHRGLVDEEVTDHAEPILRYLNVADACGFGSSALSAELEICANILRDPGPFAVYTHGDPCPDNFLLAGGRPVLIDFEWGDIRHALSDAVHLWLPFPTCWCVNRFEPGLSARLLDIYRVELGNTMPAALDDKLFGTGLMAATVAGLTRNSRINVFETDDTWGISTQRQRWQVRIQVVRETAALSGFPAIAASADQFIDKISQEWRALEPMPLYPAFR